MARRYAKRTPMTHDYTPTVSGMDLCSVCRQPLADHYRLERRTVRRFVGCPVMQTPVLWKEDMQRVLTRGRTRRVARSKHK